MMARRTVGILCVQETKWRGSKTKSFGRGLKLFYHGSDTKWNSVGIILKRHLAKSVVELTRMSDRIINLKLKADGVVLNIISAYAPQAGCQKRKRSFGTRWLK